MSFLNLTNSSGGYIDMILIVNDNSGGYLFVFFMMMFFTLLLMSLFRTQNFSIWQIFSYAAGASMIPSLIFMSIQYNDVPVLKQWVFMFFLALTAIGIMGDRLTKNQ